MEHSWGEQHFCPSVFISREPVHGGIILMRQKAHGAEVKTRTWVHSRNVANSFNRSLVIMTSTRHLLSRQYLRVCLWNNFFLRKKIRTWYLQGNFKIQAVYQAADQKVGLVTFNEGQSYSTYIQKIHVWKSSIVLVSGYNLSSWEPARH